MYRITTYALLAVLVSICPVHAAKIVKVPTANAPGAPYLIYPENDSAWSSDTTVDLYATAGSGCAPTLYRFIVWGPGGWQWVSPWISGTDWARCTTPRLRYGQYWWAAQTRNGRLIGSWQGRRGGFYVRRPPEPPGLISPANGSVVGNRSVTLTWSGSREQRGVHAGHVIYRFKVWRVGGADWSYDSAWTIRTTSAKVSLPSGGTYQWKVAASDGRKHGNFGQAWEFILDTEPPRISIAGPSVGQWTNFAALSWSVIDAASSVKRVVLQWDGGQEQIVSASGSTRVPDGKRTCAIRAQDEVGNKASASGGPYWVDTTPPTISMKVSPTEILRGASRVIKGWSISIAAGDYNGSGVASVRSSVDGGSEAADHGRIIIDQLGSHTCSVRAVDNAGNTSTTSRTVVVQEQQVPQPLPTPSPRPNPRPPAPQPEPEPEPTPTPAPPADPKRSPSPIPIPVPTPRPGPIVPQIPTPVPAKTMPVVIPPPTRQPSVPVVQPPPSKPAENLPPVQEKPLPKQEQKPAETPPAEKQAPAPSK